MLLDPGLVGACGSSFELQRKIKMRHIFDITAVDKNPNATLEGLGEFVFERNYLGARLEVLREKGMITGESGGYEVTESGQGEIKRIKALYPNHMMDAGHLFILLAVDECTGMTCWKEVDALMHMRDCKPSWTDYSTERSLFNNICCNRIKVDEDGCYKITREGRKEVNRLRRTYSYAKKKFSIFSGLSY